MDKVKLKWNLNEILPIDKFDELHSEIEKDIKQFSKYYEKLSPDMNENDFKDMMDFKESLTEKISRLYCMPDLMTSADQKSEKAKLLKNKAKTLLSKVKESNRKISHWIKGKEQKEKQILDNENAERLFNSVPDIKYVLNRSRDSAKYTLNESEEDIISKKDLTGISVLTDLRGLLTTEFNYFFKPKGVKRGQTIKNQSEVTSYFYSNKPEEREAAYKTVLGKFKENLDKLFMIYQAVVKDWGHETKLRGYDSPISIRNFNNDIPDKAIETLLEVCTENADIYQDYFRFKAKELGVEKLKRFDIYAPLKNIKTNKIPFSEAIKMALSTFEEFSPRFAKEAKKMIDKKHIDSHPGSVKRSGAFCYTISPNIDPYVLLNYTGNLRDISTLVHELGHGIHSLYANHHSIDSQDAGLPLCETASTFGEMIMFEKLLEKAENDKVKKSMLSNKMADSFATILRQNYFVKFEIKAHEAIKKGITASELSDIYLDNLKEQFGDSVSIDDCFKYEWAYIPHLVRTPFYCYAYSFGELLSLALFSEYKKQGKAFVPKIEKILAYGGSENPQKILNEVGIDITSKDFWQGSFDIIRGWQKQLERYQ